MLNAKRQEEMREREKIIERRKTQKRRLTKRAQERAKKTRDSRPAEHY